MKSASLVAETDVSVSVAQARQWFMDLETHPERYQFETHAGFEFIDGNFGQVGARFRTWERFCGIEIELRFELIEVQETEFQFRLLCPALPVWGAFVIEPVADGVCLRLAIGGTTSFGSSLLRLGPFRGAIQRQIEGEVRHVKASMETFTIKDKK